MPCCNCNRQTETTYNVKLKFLRSELLYDVQNYAYVESDIMGEEKQHAQHQLADVCEDGNVDRVSRILAVVHAEVKEMLYPYTKRAPSDMEVDDILEAPERYDVDMTVPESMSETTVQLLSKLIHEYMVYRVMADWLAITNKQAAAGWMERAEATKEQIDAAKSNRRQTMLRKMFP